MKYRLTEKIGSGGMAEIFRAVGQGPEGFERAFVVKRIHPRLSDAPEFVRMFVDEAKISARLIHPNIVQVFDFAYEGSVYTIVMEPVDGVDMGRLFRALERRKELAPPLFVAEVARQVCRGLEFAHTLTGVDGKPLLIVHRDVTPPNIMVDWNGTVKILDFGLARAVQELRTNTTEAGTVKGKMSYVSPEQIQGKMADARSDVFSLGIVLHELLTVRRLFVGESDLETLKMVSEMAIVRPSEHNREVKPGLDAIVMKALERDPDKRYQSAREMGDDLEDFVVRRRYSTRALAEKARQLAPTEAEEPNEALPVVVTDEERNDAVTSGAVPTSVIVADTSGRRRSDNSPAKSLTPPPPPPEAVIPRGASNVQKALGLSAAAGWLLLALGLAGVAATTASLMTVLRPVAQKAQAPTMPPSPTVRVALDSVPQGATVTATGAGVLVAGAGSTPGSTTAAASQVEGGVLGRTPLVLEMRRGETPIELVLTRTDFASLTFHVIPNRDKDAIATLERPVAPPVLAAVPAQPEEAAPRGKRRRSRRSDLASGRGSLTSTTAPSGARPVALGSAVSSRR